MILFLLQNCVVVQQYDCIFLNLTDSILIGQHCLWRQWGPSGCVSIGFQRYLHLWLYSPRCESHTHTHTHIIQSHTSHIHCSVPQLLVYSLEYRDPTGSRKEKRLRTSVRLAYALVYCTTDFVKRYKLFETLIDEDCFACFACYLTLLSLHRAIIPVYWYWPCPVIISRKCFIIHIHIALCFHQFRCFITSGVTPRIGTSTNHWRTYGTYCLFFANLSLACLACLNQSINHTTILFGRQKHEYNIHVHIHLCKRTVGFL